MRLHFRVWLILPFLICTIDALRILVVFPFSAKSHSILGHGVVTNLLRAGHEVVHYTSFPSNKEHANLTEVDVSYLGKPTKDMAEKFEQFKLKNLVGKGNIVDSALLLQLLLDFNRRLMQDKNMVQFLSDPKEHFDLVILQWFFSDLTAGIASLFKCPFIWVGTTEAHAHVLRLVDQVPNPAYSVDLFSDLRPPLSFTQRVSELWGLLKKMVYYQFMIMPSLRSSYNEIYPSIAAKRGVTIPSYDEVVYNSSLLLLNSHPSIGTPFTLPQNAKYVAGYHIDRSPKPLTKEFKKIMDESKHGVIYFSLGSNIKSSDMSTEMKQSFLNTFSTLKETVIWKFEEEMDHKASNIHLVKWAPQQSILAHPNCKIFVTHGGQLSTTEAIHYGVPVIGIPILGDQHVNMQSVVQKGFGLKLDLTEDVGNNLKPALDEMLKNSSYKNSAKRISQIYHDRPLTPEDELIFWVEHVAKTQGALHLRSPALHVPFYQKLFLDLLACIIAVLVALYVIAQKVMRRLKGSKKVSVNKKKK